MAGETKIQWCDATYNPWLGCSKVAEGCLHCYAETLMDTRYGRVEWGPEGTRSRTKTQNQPLHWNREAAVEGKRRKVFCASLADVFEDYRGPSPKEGLGPWRADLFRLIDDCQNLDWLILTKRPENILGMWKPRSGCERYRDNVWLGTSISNQKNAEEYVPRLLTCRNLVPVLFLSIEPQIGSVDVTQWLGQINWLIVGGESKQGREEARPFDVEWARSLVRQCAAADVPCFVKQMGSQPRELDMASGRMLPLKLVDKHGGDIAEWEKDLRVRQCPETHTREFIGV